MSFDKPTRNRLAKFVADARRVIADEFTEQFQSLYGISAQGVIAPLDRLGHLDEAGLATAALLRERIEYLEKTHPDDQDGTRAAVARLAREQAFTILNRLAAIRMAEKRGLIVESVGQGYQSRGFKVFETVAGSALGEAYQRYRRFLFCLFDELALDLGVLFDRRSPQALLFPREPALLALLDLLRAADLEPLWAEDETIGWIYQYYNDPAERKKMRDESAAPRNSRELAVRNQFFTPRYVVEFLTDNTLGRIWYEMTRGQTRLKDQCRYLVRRPTEIFLAEGEAPPSDSGNPQSEIQNPQSQEELLRAPVHIPHRPIKDPREIRLLDPACGSMHFGLYAFDLFETIYEEAWDLADTHSDLRSLTSDFSSKEEFLRQVPRLNIEHNIHGIDIDPRAVQIAGLSLWLRAQRAWQAQGLPAAARPRIRRSNIVCAEPMPGSPEMLEDFVITLDPPLLGELVRTVFEKMQLAGEAGSLLKIEEEIRGAIESAKKAWSRLQTRPQELFSTDELNRTTRAPELTGFEQALTSDLRPLTSDFWETAEQQVIDALRAYAEQADADSYQRRLFADDAARGFAFIDLCRKRYDAVVMNPPFGASSVDSGKYIKASFKDAASDLYSCFILRGLHLNIGSKGKVGAITNRTGFFIDQLADWRGSVVAKTETIADLGSGVLDALVEAAAYIVDSSDSSCRNGNLAFELLSEDDKGGALLEAIQDSKAGKSTQITHFWSSKSLQAIPGSPLAYWVTQGLLHPFSDRPSLREAGFDAQIGVSTKDDFRFLRLRWETEIKKFRDKWFPLAKGGEYSRYWSDIYLLINFQSEARELHAYIANKYPYLNGNTSWVVHPESGYLRPGLTYTRRTSSPLSVRILPEGCVFSDMGRGIIHQSDNKAELMTLLGLANARVFRHFVELCVAAGDAAARTYEGGILNQMPSIAADPDVRRWATELALAKRSAFAADETTAFFTSPDPSRDLASVVDLFQELQPRIEKACCGLLQLNDGDFRTIDTRTPEKGHVETPSNWAAQHDSLVDLSYCLGTSFGRWDIRYATGERQPPELPDPFDPLPVCPPGMLQNAEGLPAEPKDVPADYPLRISWPGILVDDENHPEDIVARVREAIEVIWKDRAEAIEQEACGILGVKTLRDYFRRPAAFFADHLKRYSKSRRQAPIYWPLSTKSGSYTLWLYYHRLTDQTLHTCLADFLDPKIRRVQAELDAVTGQGSRVTGESAKAGDLREFLDELKDLRDELERVIKLPWKPNLNDGVLITASPLHKLFRLPKWQKDLKACWDKLAKGDYDWAHLAYTIWPARVEKACEKDRSIAIAHNREDLCKVEAPKPKKKRAKKKGAEEEEELELNEED